jgi:hypothetical protein
MRHAQADFRRAKLITRFDHVRATRSQIFVETPVQRVTR